MVITSQEQQLGCSSLEEVKSLRSLIGAFFFLALRLVGNALCVFSWSIFVRQALPFYRPVSGVSRLGRVIMFLGCCSWKRCLLFLCVFLVVFNINTGRLKHVLASRRRKKNIKKCWQLWVLSTFVRLKRLITALQDQADTKLLHRDYHRWNTK